MLGFSYLAEPMDKIRKYLNELPVLPKFLFRLIYPIVIFMIMYSIAKSAGVQNTNMIKLIFLFLWATIEYFLYFSYKKNQQ